MSQEIPWKFILFSDGVPSVKETLEDVYTSPEAMGRRFYRQCVAYDGEHQWDLVPKQKPTLFDPIVRMMTGLFGIGGANAYVCYWKKGSKAGFAQAHNALADGAARHAHLYQQWFTKEKALSIIEQCETFEDLLLAAAALQGYQESHDRVADFIK